MKEKYPFSVQRLREIENNLELLLKKARQKHPSLPLLLDHADVLQLLKISVNTSGRWRKSGILPYSRIQQKLYFRYEDIEKLLKKQLKDEP